MKQPTFKKSLRTSFSLHILLFVLASGVLFKGCQGDSSNSTDKPNANSNITEAPKEVEVEIVTEDDLKGPEPAKKEKATERSCPKEWYGGIGVINSVDTLGRAIITSVPKGYPADRAGFEVGDELIDGCPKCIDEIGEEIDVSIRKNDGNVKEYHLIRERICVDRT